MARSKVRRVMQYDKEGNVLARYPNIKTASMMTGIGISDISRCCNHLRKASGGYVWAFEGEEPVLDGVAIIKRYDLMGKYIESFNSVPDIAKKYPEYYIGYIRKCLNREKKTYKSSLWIYSGQENDIPKLMQEYGQQVVAIRLDKSDYKYYGNLGIASIKTGINRVMLNRSIVKKGLCHGYAWFKYFDKKSLEDFENYRLSYRAFNKREQILVIWPNEERSKIFNSVSEAAEYTELPAHLCYCLLHGTCKEDSQGYQFLYNEEEETQ